MALVTLKDILRQAARNDYGVGSFNVASTEIIMGAVRAAEELNSPIILQVAEVRLKHSPLHLIGSAMVAAAKQARVPVAVHFDHGSSLELIRTALDLGFTSVMFDGSSLPLAENIDKTKTIVELAGNYGASVEAEVGRVGGSEDNSEDIEMLITQVEDAKRFFESTRVDALAIAIGNVHGVYRSEPNLQFGRLQAIHEAIAVPLVLHGGSGITVEDFRRCIKHGIRKINVQTATYNAVVGGVADLLRQGSQVEYFTYHNRVIDAACGCVKQHIEAFQSRNWAWTGGLR